MTRRPHDFYPTPAKAVEWLFRFWGPPHTILEPCAGNGQMADAMRNYRAVVRTSDIDPRWGLEVYDARKRSARSYAAVITNPPFNQAIDIVWNFAEQRVPCAFLLRLSFLEPTEARGPWLAAHPPTGLIVCPRISFTGDGKTDSVTTAWMLWNTAPLGIVIVPKEE